MGYLAIIGGGPAGYVAAITAASKGRQVILIEQRELGGTCLNEGCMPTKSLIESAKMYDKVKHAGKFGIRIPTHSIEMKWGDVQERKNEIVKKLVQGIGYLMKKNKIKVIKGKAEFITDHILNIEKADGQERLEADQFMIAAGSEPIELPFAPFDGNWVLNSTHVLSLPRIPTSLLIVGGGVIGCEFASIYSRLGTKVTIIEMADQLIPGEDQDIVSVLRDELEKSGVTIFTSTALKQLNAVERIATFENGSGVHQQQADYVLVSIGRKPRISELGLDKIGVQYSKRGIQVNEHMQTNIPHIYACGDVVGGIQLAHVAFHEGTVAALHASGEDVKVNYRAIPRCVYTSPEIASVGKIERQARDDYGDIQVGEFPFMANGKALIQGEEVGKTKIIVEPQYNEIVGISIVGPSATELIGQGTVMLHAELTADMMQNFIAGHPTLSEAIHEALLATLGHSVHY